MNGYHSIGNQMFNGTYTWTNPYANRTDGPCFIAPVGYEEYTFNKNVIMINDQGQVIKIEGIRAVELHETVSER